MVTPPHQSAVRMRWVRTAADGLGRLTTAGLADGGRLADRALGTPVTDHRTSWVRHVIDDGIDVYVKTYDYPTRRDRWRGLGRTTALARSRAAREWDALTWLRRAGFAAPRPVAVAEARRHGLLRRAILVTEAWPGTPIDRLLPALDAADRRTALVDAVHAFVARLHAAGFRDRNLDLRNLLARPAGDGFEITKIDSPRYRLVRPGRHGDRLEREDLARLRTSLRSAGAC